MRGQSQAASARLPAARPGRRWSIWLEQTSERRRRAREERLETIERLDAERRRARRTGEYARRTGEYAGRTGEYSPNLRRLS